MHRFGTDTLDPPIRAVMMLLQAVHCTDPPTA